MQTNSERTIRTQRAITRRRRLWTAAAVALVAVHVAGPDGALGSLTYLTVAVGTAVAACVGALRPDARRRVAAPLALGITASTIGDLIFALAPHVFGGPLDHTSVADVLWIAAYAGIAGALFALLRLDRRRRFDVEGLVDAAVVLVVSSIVLWHLVVRQTATDEALAPLDRFVWTLYPALDVVVLVLVVRVLVRRRTPTVLLVAAGALAWLAADLANLVVDSGDAHAAWLDAGWLLGAVALAAATTHSPRSDTVQEPRRAAEDGVGLGRVALVLGPLLVPSLIELHVFATGGDNSELVPLTAVTALLLVLAFLRAARLAFATRAAQRRLRSRERHATALAQNSSDAVVLVDARRRVVDEHNLTALTGRAGRLAVGVDLLALVAADHLDDVRDVVDRSLAAPGQVFETTLRVDRGDDREVWLSARLVNLLDDPDVAAIVVNLHDVTARTRAERELNHRAFHDALTGLANRALFRNRLDHALDRDAGTDSSAAVIFLDLDGFKAVNDCLGHDAGDELLREVAVRLGSAASRGDTVGRLGGDEFAVLIEASPRPLDDATALADRILHALARPFVLDTREVVVTASLGIAAGDAESTAADLVRNADVAMYHAKTTGKARWATYDPRMRTAAVERLELGNDVRRALDRGELHLRYQPVVELATGDVVGFEALLRWRHPVRGDVPPDRFVPIAEENGCIVPIGRWVLREAAATAARWHARLGDGRRLTMAVNVSGRQLSSAELVADVEDALACSGLDPASLVLEMTETVLIGDAPAASRRLHELRRLGVRLAIDDFGTGYSSLSRLCHFPVDILKIDRSFVSAVTDGGELPAIVRGLLDLGRTLQLETIAEGVELDAQRAQLRTAGCDYAQGYLFARPLAAADAAALLGVRDDDREPLAAVPGR